MANVSLKNGKKDITNQRFGRLVAIEYAYYDGNLSFWKCKCDCGNVLNVALSRLTTNKQISCGCFAKERLRERMSTHGDSGTREYKCWQQIKQRCYNPKVKAYSDYGGRGIVMSDRWKDSYEAFITDMGQIPVGHRHTIERRDVNGNYEKSNCYWATYDVQARNKRDNHFITINGETMVFVDWCKRLNIPNTTVHAKARIRKITVEEYLTDIASGVPVTKYLHKTIAKETLIDLRRDKKLRVKEIANILGCSVGNIEKFIKLYGIYTIRSKNRI